MAHASGPAAAIPRCKSITMGAGGPHCPSYKGDVVTDLDISVSELGEFHLEVLKDFMNAEGIACDPATDCVVYAGEQDLCARAVMLMDDSVYALACILKVNGCYDNIEEKGVVFGDYSMMLHYECPDPNVLDYEGFVKSIDDLIKEFSSLDSYTDTLWLEEQIDEQGFTELGDLLEALKNGATVTSTNVHFTICILKDGNSETDLTRAGWEAEHGRVHGAKRQRTD